jgi:hypothetical protein
MLKPLEAVVEKLFSEGVIPSVAGSPATGAFAVAGVE